jgi:hypothetical protein
MGKTYAKIERELAKTLKERPPKNPRVPTFPPAPERLAQKLREIIDVGNGQSLLAYAALSRLCVMWTPNAIPTDASGLGGGQYAQVVNEMLGLMHQLFPGGEGLPTDDEVSL